MSKPDNGKSPYQKYGKVPHRYSQTYQNWKQAALRGDSGAMRHHGELHSRQFPILPVSAPLAEAA